jgi:hypothetical protein
MIRVTSFSQLYPIVGTRPELESVVTEYPEETHLRLEGLREGRDELERSYKDGDHLRVILLSMCLCEDLVKSNVGRGRMMTTGLWDVTKKLQREGRLGYNLSGDLGLIWTCRTGITHFLHLNSPLVTKETSKWFRDVFHRTWDSLMT